jgi:sulfite reductase (NADPH) flavoprotein alpha-component
LYNSVTRGDGIYKLEARQGVGSAIQGFVAASSGSTKPISVLADPAALFLIAPAIAEISANTASSASLVVQVASNRTNVAEVYDALRVLQLSSPGFRGEIIFSGAKGGKEVVAATTYAYKQSNKVIISVFDDVEAGQELAIFGGSAEEAAFQPITYAGPKDPTTVLLLPSSQHAAVALAALASMESAATEKVAILIVHSVSADTFGEALAAHLPSSVQSVYAPTANSDVDVSATWFYDLALSSVVSSGKSTATVFTLPLVATWTIYEWAATIVRIASPSSSKAFSTPHMKPLLPASSTSKLASFWSSDIGASAKVAPAIAAAFAEVANNASEGGVAPRLLETFDNFAGAKNANGLGVKSADLLLSRIESSEENKKLSETALSALTLTSTPSYIFVSAPKSILSSYNAIERAGPETQIVFSGPWAAEEYKEKLGRHEIGKLSGHQGLWTINADAIAKDAGFASDKVQEAVSTIEQIAFWRFYLNNDDPAQISGLVKTELSQEDIQKLVPATKTALYKIDLSSSDMEVDEEAKATPLDQLAPGEADTTILAHPSFIGSAKASHGPNLYKTNDEFQPEAKNWHLAAKQLLYPEAYQLPTTEKEKMRPDLPEENFVITVTENRRLTPLDYDRNVFHMEFSTAGTGLKYSVGEALGIHGLNDEQEVLEFIEWYGLKPDTLVTYPSRTEPDGKLEVRTVFQLFQQTLDIFGKPPKSFYEVLGKYATTREEARQLRFISSAEGSSTFKKWAELDTVTYVDVLKAFPSAKANFGIQELIREVSSIKPRHYSIASSQNAVGDSVHLLIVTVDWDTPAGRKRYGQCTRYLVNLAVGAKVMVSVKPSVMKVSSKWCRRSYDHVLTTVHP